VLLPLPVPVEPGAPAPPPLAPPPPPAPAWARQEPQESAATIAAQDKVVIVFMVEQPRTLDSLSYRALD
jgi:hypothetical protein